MDQTIPSPSPRPAPLGWTWGHVLVQRAGPGLMFGPYLQMGNIWTFVCFNLNGRVWQLDSSISCFSTMHISRFLTFDSHVKFYHTILSYSFRLKQIHENYRFTDSMEEGIFFGGPRWFKFSNLHHHGIHCQMLHGTSSLRMIVQKAECIFRNALGPGLAFFTMS